MNDELFYAVLATDEEHSPDGSVAFIYELRWAPGFILPFQVATMNADKLPMGAASGDSLPQAVTAFSDRARVNPGATWQAVVASLSDCRKVPADVLETIPGVALVTCPCGGSGWHPTPSPDESRPCPLHAA